MKIGIVVGQTFVGGMERQVAFLTQGFKDKKHDVFVYTTSPNISFSKRAKVNLSKKNIYPLWGTKYSNGLSNYLLEHYVKKHKIDILIAFQIGSIEICNRIKMKLGYPLVIGNIRGIQYAFNEDLKNRYKKGCIAADALVCNSQAGLQLLKQHIVKSSNIPVLMIPNIVSAPKVDYRLKQDQFNVLFAASLKEVKDPFTFIRGVASAIKNNVNIHVNIAGDGPFREKLEEFVHEKKLHNNITFLGSLKPEEVPYNKASIVVSTSLREASSNTILEALVNGACVIGTNVGGTTELLESKSFGSLIEIGESEKLSKLILYYSNLSSNELVEKGENARNYIISNFEKEKIEDIYINFFKKLING